MEAPPPQGGFFSFRSLITPALIRAIYAIGALLITAISLVTILYGAGILESEQMAGWFFMPMPILEGPADAVWLGLAILIVGNLVWRVICEIGLVLFNIYDRLASIESRLRRPLTERHDVKRRK